MSALLRRRETWLWTLIVIVALAIGVGVPKYWRWRTLPQRIQAVLPAIPDLAKRPEELREAVGRARARAFARASAFVGLVELGQLYHANGFLSEAEACWRLLVAEQPRDARWHYYLADVLRTTSDYASMRAELERTARLAPDYAPAWLRLADYAFKIGEFDLALSCYRKRLTLLPGDSYARLALARIERRAGQSAAARAAIELLVRDQPKFAPAQNLFAEILAAEGNEDAARMHRWHGREAGRMPEPDDPWMAELTTKCHDPERLRVLATYEFQINQPDRARDLAAWSVELAPSDPAGYELLGDLLLKLGDANQAQTILANGIQRCGVRATVRLYISLSEAYRALDDPAGAIAVVRDGLTRWPDAFELHNVLGVALGTLDRHAEAIKAFRAEVALSPGDAEANFNLGVELLNARQIDEARDSFKRALTAQPTFPKALLYLGRMELEAGNLAVAHDYIFPLFDAHPGQAHAQRLMALWHLRAGLGAKSKNDLPLAEQHFRAGAKFDATFAEPLAELGVLCLTQNRVSDAVPPLKSLRQLQPDDPHGAMLLGQAYARLGRIEEARNELQAGVVLAERAGNQSTAQFCREILGRL